MSVQDEKGKKEYLTILGKPYSLEFLRGVYAGVLAAVTVGVVVRWLGIM